MQGWYIGITAASQAVKAGSTPVPCSTQIKRPMHRCIGRFSLSKKVTFWWPFSRIERENAV